MGPWSSGPRARSCASSPRRRFAASTASPTITSGSSGATSRSSGRTGNEAGSLPLCRAPDWPAGIRGSAASAPRFLVVDETDHVLEVESLLFDPGRDLLAFDDFALVVDLVDLALGLGAVACVDLEVFHQHAAPGP